MREKALPDPVWSAGGLYRAWSIEGTSQAVKPLKAKQAEETNTT
jgi:hypothetical protein